MAKDDGAAGVWRTVGGRRIFIKTGQTLADAMHESGKFPMAKKGLPGSGAGGIMQVGAEEFAKAIAGAKASLPASTAWRVDAKDAREYAGCKCYVTGGGSCVAVKPDGDIVSVCRKMGDPVRGSELLDHAVKNGGTKLDAFGKQLYGFYTRNGFEPVSWTPFNDAYAPKGWIAVAYDREPVVFYKHTGTNNKRSYGSFLIFTAPHTGSNGYGEAAAARDGGM